MSFPSAFPKTPTPEQRRRWQIEANNESWEGPVSNPRGIKSQPLAAISEVSEESSEKQPIPKIDELQDKV